MAGVKLPADGTEVEAVTFGSVEYGRKPQPVRGELKTHPSPFGGLPQCWVGGVQVNPVTVRPDSGGANLSGVPEVTESKADRRQRELHVAIALAMVEAALRKKIGADTDGDSDDLMRWLPELASDHGEAATAMGAKLLGWIRAGESGGPTHSGKPRWKDETTGKYRYQKSQPGEHTERRRQAGANAARGGDIINRVMFNQHTPAELHELDHHLDSMTVPQLRTARAKLRAAFGNAKRRDEMVAALRRHVQMRLVDPEQTPSLPPAVPPKQTTDQAVTDEPAVITDSDGEQMTFTKPHARGLVAEHAKLHAANTPQSEASVGTQHEVRPGDFVTTEDLNQKDQDRIDSIAEMFPETGSMPPVVYRQNGDGSKELLDGHHRYLIARDRGDSLPAVGLTQHEYDTLSHDGYSKDEIVRAALGAATGVDPEHLSQYDSVYGRANEDAELLLRSLRHEGEKPSPTNPTTGVDSPTNGGHNTPVTSQTVGSDNGGDKVDTTEPAVMTHKISADVRTVSNDFGRGVVVGKEDHTKLPKTGQAYQGRTVTSVDKKGKTYHVTTRPMNDVEKLDRQIEDHKRDIYSEHEGGRAAKPVEEQAKDSFRLFELQHLRDGAAMRAKGATAEQIAAHEAKKPIPFPLDLGTTADGKGRYRLIAKVGDSALVQPDGYDPILMNPERLEYEAGGGWAVRPGSFNAGMARKIMEAIGHGGAA